MSSDFDGVHAESGRDCLYGVADVTEAVLHLLDNVLEATSVGAKLVDNDSRGGRISAGHGFVLLHFHNRRTGGLMPKHSRRPNASGRLGN